MGIRVANIHFFFFSHTHTQHMLVTFAFCDTENEKVKTVQSRFFFSHNYRHLLIFSVIVKILNIPLLSTYFG